MAMFDCGYIDVCFSYTYSSSDNTDHTTHWCDQWSLTSHWPGITLHITQFTDQLLHHSIVQWSCDVHNINVTVINGELEQKRMILFENGYFKTY